MAAFDLPAAASSTPPASVLLTAEKGQGLQISGVVVPGAHGAPAYELTFTNRTAAPLDGFQLQFNKNAFALAPASQPRVETVPPGESRRCSLPLALTGQSSGSAATGALQVAVKSPRQNGAVFYFSDQVPLEALLLPDAEQKASDAFAQQWQTSPEQARTVAAPAALGGVEQVVARLRALRWNLVTQQAMAGTPFTAAYFSGKTPGPEGEKTLLVQVVTAPGSPEAKVAVRSSVPGFAEMVFASMQRALA
jgi:AP-1 complex subunit beta-1